MTGRVEILIESDSGTFLGTGTSWAGLRVRYRQEGTRRWQKFIAVGQPGQSLRDLLSAAIAVVARAEVPFDGGKLDGLQLELDGAAA